MPRKRTRLSEAEAQELQQAYLNTKNGPWRTRYQAVRLYGLGYAVSEIVALTGCSQSRLGAWYRAYRAGGVASWRDGRQGGNRARLTASEVRDLQARLEQYTPRQVLGDTAATADGQFWTVDDLRAVVTRWYAVQSQRPTFDRHLFERGGFSSQKPSAV